MFNFCSTEPVEIKHGSKVTYLIHKIKNLKNGEDTALRIEGISPTDYCLDLIRLYKPKLNIASERNFELLRDLLTDGLDFKKKKVIPIGSFQVFKTSVNNINRTEKT